MIAALAERRRASSASRPGSRRPRAAFAFVRRADDGGRPAAPQLARRPRQRPATLDDYANMSRAALALSEATGDKSYIAAAEGWVAILDAQYWDSAGGGYFFTAGDTRDVIIRRQDRR